MSTRTVQLVSAALLISLAGCSGGIGPASTAVAQRAGVSAPRQWPTTSWAASSPEAQGISSNDLADALEFARANDINIHSLTIVRNGVIVLDAYFYPFAPETRHDVASATKSVVSMVVGIATADGHLGGLLQPVVSALPPASIRQADERATRIRIGDLLKMQSGFDCGFKRGEPELREMRNSSDWVAHALHLRTIAEPGTRFGYCSPNFHLLSAAIATTTKLKTLDYARARLFGPLGINDVYWPADSMGFNHGWGDLQLRPRDMAKLGLLMLHGGRWADRQILSTTWIDSSVTTQAIVNENENYGLGWWISRTVPTLFEANGRGGQRISVVPGRNIVVVMTGGGFEPGDIGRFLLRAVRADAALPEDPGGQTRLANALRLIAASPASRAVTKSATAKQVSGRVYSLAENALGIRSFSVDFSDSTVGALRLRLTTGQELVQPLGLDGQYRVTSDQSGAVSAGRGEWLPDGRFRIEFNRLSLINRYVVDVEFRDDEVRIVANEPTELGTANLRGTAPPRAPLR